MKEVVAYVVASHGYSQRRACSLSKQHRSTQRKPGGRDPRTEVRQRMRDIAATRVRYGYRRIHVLLRREGWARGRSGPAQQAAATAEDGGAARGTLPAHASKRGLEPGPHPRSARRRHQVPGTDGSGCAQPRELGHRDGTTAEGRARGGGAEPPRSAAWRAEHPVCQQRIGVHGPPSRSVGVPVQGPDRLLAARQANGQRVDAPIPVKRRWRARLWVWIGCRDSCRFRGLRSA